MGLAEDRLAYIILPFAPGGLTEILKRTVLQCLGEDPWPSSCRRIARSLR
jgi:hypothetical protein